MLLDNILHLIIIVGKSGTSKTKIKNLAAKVGTVTRRVQYSSKGTKVKVIYYSHV
jgi:ABC-type phosphonate transport system ATPase subunit